MGGSAKSDGAAGRQAQGRQKRQRYIDFVLRGLRQRYLQRKAQKKLMEVPNATWKIYVAIIQREGTDHVSSNFLNDEERT